MAPQLPADEVAKLSGDELSDYLARQMLASLNRYKGRPDLLVQENPHRDLRRFEKKAPAA